MKNAIEGEKRLFTLGPSSSFVHYKNVKQITSLDNDIINSIWQLRPSAPQFITIFNGQREIPRKQLAMGRDYAFSGQVSHAVTWNPLIARVRDILTSIVGVYYNGCLLNFYEGPNEYIGPHSDAENGLVEGQPITVVSFGVPRRFRFTAKHNLNKESIVAQKEVIIEHGDIVVMQCDTQKTHKHEVRKPIKKGTPLEDYEGKRVSLTFRVFA